MSKAIKLSDQQYRILSILWEKGEASAKDVQMALTTEPLAHTTIATILTRLEKKGFLSSILLRRERVFKPSLKKSDVQTSMVSGLVSTLFGGDRAALFAHLLQEGEVDEAEFECLQELLKKGKRNE